MEAVAAYQGLIAGLIDSYELRIRESGRAPPVEVL